MHHFFIVISDVRRVVTELNKDHKRRLLIGLRYVNDLLADIEGIMATSVDPQVPFPKYVADITPAQRKIITAEIAHIREEMYRILENKNIKIDPPFISAVRAVQNAIHFADIAMEEMRPKYMRGYGELTGEAVRDLDEVVSRMQKLLRQILRALR
ncbi:MAG: hypothetical protein FJ139_03685 [Deltaproteobacteria bacterium]|nr:hypothetical protein [Deltaproteobacteria bacterium]